MKIKEYIGTITLESGLHIGADDSEIHIGGVDNSVIKDPLTMKPYIPGSSLKGKIRSLLEYYTGVYVHCDGFPVQIKHLNSINNDEKKYAENIIKLFGTGGNEKKEHTEKFNITRLSFSDCFLINGKEIEDKIGKITEVKAENSIDRIKGTAQSPRFIERVVKGAEFEFKVSMKMFDDDEELEELLLKGFSLLEKDALGGSGSRGYGRVSICFYDESVNNKFNDLKSKFNGV